MPPLTVEILLVAGGLVLLATGGELLVRGASGLAVRMGIRPLVIGLTVVAVGTTTPELGVSLQAAMRGNADIALGNVVGSNICNLLFILGLTAIIHPVQIRLQVLRTDIPILIAATALALGLLLRDGSIGPVEGAFLAAGLVAYMAFSVIMARRAPPEDAETGAHLIEDVTPSRPGRGLLAGSVVIGLGLLFLGSRFLVDGAVALAGRAGVPEAVIGLTLVAIGTSLPEVATAIVGAIRGKTDLVVGNLIGANLYNLLFILGLTGIIRPLSMGGVTWTDLVVMLAATLVVIPLMRSGWVLKRWEGTLMLVGYLAYIAWLARGALGAG